jgi:hypothetical protein
MRVSVLSDGDVGRMSRTHIKAGKDAVKGIRGVLIP